MAISKKTREAVYAKYDGHCAYCGRAIAYRDMQVDHFLPLRAYSIEDAGRMIFQTSCQPAGCATTTSGQTRWKHSDDISQKSQRSYGMTTFTRFALSTEISLRTKNR